MVEQSGATEDEPLYFEDLHVGDQNLSGGRTVTEADVVNFAGLSGDFHGLHMDETFAINASYGRRIAHGMLIVAMTAGLVLRLPLMRRLERTTLALAGVNVRFLRPVFIGDTIKVDLVVVEMLESRSKPDRGSVVMRRSVVNQRQELAVEGLWTLMVKRCPANFKAGAG